MKLSSVFGQLSGAARVNPSAPMRALNPHNSAGYEFGRAYVRELGDARNAARASETPLYGPDARLRAERGTNDDSVSDYTVSGNAASDTGIGRRAAVGYGAMGNASTQDSAAQDVYRDLSVGSPTHRRGLNRYMRVASHSSTMVGLTV